MTKGSGMADNEQDQQAFRETVQRFAKERSPMTKVRSVMEGPDGYDPAIWKGLIEELGVHALAIPEEYGGLGLGVADLALALEELGYALTPSPFYSSACATSAVLLTGSDEQRKRLLPRIAEGELTGTVAFAEPRRGWDEASVHTVYENVDAAPRLTGVKSYVVDGMTADFFVVAARRPDTSGRDGVGLFLVQADAPGLERRPLRTMDGTRLQAEVVLSGVVAEPLAGSGDEDAFTLVAAHCALYLCADMVGGARRCLEMAVDYAKIRVQFGRVIGSFQAIKHKAADVLVATESARAALQLAAAAADENDDQFLLLAHVAKATCSDAYFRAAAENIQIHGGIGFTWEHDAHLYFKRAKSSEVLWGNGDFHREALAHRLELV